VRWEGVSAKERSPYARKVGWARFNATLTDKGSDRTRRAKPYKRGGNVTTLRIPRSVSRNRDGRNDRAPSRRSLEPRHPRGAPPAPTRHNLVSLYSDYGFVFRCLCVRSVAVLTNTIVTLAAILVEEDAVPALWAPVGARHTLGRRLASLPQRRSFEGAS